MALLDRVVRVESEDDAFLRGLSACFRLPVNGRDGRACDLTVRIGTRPPDRDERFLTVRSVEASSPTFVPLGPVRCPLDVCSAINQWAALNTARYYVFHAGAVSRSGQAILLPAGSGAGKSTTTAGLLRRGFQLLSDEIGAIDMHSGRMVGYPRSLSLREDVLQLLGLERAAGLSFPPFPGRFFEPEALGSARAEGDATPVLAATPRYSPGASTRLERLRGGAALMALLNSSCSQSVHKVAGLDWVIALLGRVPCYQLTFSDLEHGLTVLEEAFERHAGGER